MHLKRMAGWAASGVPLFIWLPRQSLASLPTDHSILGLFTSYDSSNDARNNISTGHSSCGWAGTRVRLEYVQRCEFIT